MLACFISPNIYEVWSSLTSSILGFFVQGSDCPNEKHHTVCGLKWNDTDSFSDGKTCAVTDYII